MKHYDARTYDGRWSAEVVGLTLTSPGSPERPKMMGPAGDGQSLLVKIHGNVKVGPRVMGWVRTPDELARFAPLSEWYFIPKEESAAA